jgi:uncharacterized SAM-binding protein YcdF (DUF218 family)
MSGRLVAVLGYSGRRNAELHRICAERVAHAQAIATGSRAVLFSGMPEAELMRASWTGPDVELLADLKARSTAENAANIARTARELRVDEVIAVTSRWHRLRTLLLLNAALRGTGIALSVETAAGSPPLPLLARELVCVALLPVQLGRVAYAVRPRAESQSRTAG